MSTDDALRAILIHVVTPVAGLALYAALCFRMRRRGVVDPPYLSFLFLFGTLGGWLLVGLTLLFWSWSGMASVGAIYLLFVSPFIAAAVAVITYPERSQSPFHRGAFVLCVCYACAVLIVDAVWII